MDAWAACRPVLPRVWGQSRWPRVSGDGGWASGSNIQREERLGWGSRKGPSPTSSLSSLLLAFLKGPPCCTGGHRAFLPGWGCRTQQGRSRESWPCLGTGSGGLIVVQSLSHVRLFATPWNAARQASLFITSSQSLLKLISIESVMTSNHLVLCHPLLLLPSIFPSIRDFSNESALCTRWPKYQSFIYSISQSFQ